MEVNAKEDSGLQEMNNSATKSQALLSTSLTNYNHKSLHHAMSQSFCSKQSKFY